MTGPINLAVEREKRRPPSLSPPDKLRKAQQLIAEYADEITTTSMRDFGAVDCIAYEVNTLGVIVGRYADDIEAEQL